MISFLANRPALQIGPYQVLDYDTVWLEDAILRAAHAADQSEFSLHCEIRQGIDLYLEQRCPLQLLHLEDLFDRVRKMLSKIGCQRIADELVVIAPPITVSLVEKAEEAGNGYELAFFEGLRVDLSELKQSGASIIHITGIRESAAILRGQTKWTKNCGILFNEIQSFVEQCLGESLEKQVEPICDPIAA